ncbi:MAG: hypothetical protein ABT940_03115 [Alphaproteobacteria bacterium]
MTCTPTDFTDAMKTIISREDLVAAERDGFRLIALHLTALDPDAVTGLELFAGMLERARR